MKKFVASTVWLVLTALLFIAPRASAQNPGAMQVTTGNGVLLGDSPLGGRPGWIQLQQVTIVGGTPVKSQIASASVTSFQQGDVQRPVVTGQNWTASQPPSPALVPQGKAAPLPAAGTSKDWSTQRKVGTPQTSTPLGGNASASDGLAVGKARHSDIKVTKQVDTSSPQLFADTVKGESPSSTTATLLASATQPARPTTGGSRRVTVTVIKKVDAASPILRRTMNSGNPLQGAVIEVYQPGSSVVIERIQLQQLLVTSIQVSGALVPTETITFTGTKIGN